MIVRKAVWANLFRSLARTFATGFRLNPHTVDRTMSANVASKVEHKAVWFRRYSDSVNPAGEVRGVRIEPLRVNRTGSAAEHLNV